MQCLSIILEYKLFMGLLLYMLGLLMNLLFVYVSVGVGVGIAVFDFHSIVLV